MEHDNARRSRGPQGTDQSARGDDQAQGAGRQAGGAGQGRSLARLARGDPAPRGALPDRAAQGPVGDSEPPRAVRQARELRENVGDMIMADGTTPGAPGDWATQVAILGALVHLTERLTGAGQPGPAPYY